MEHLITKALTDVCEVLKLESSGFTWVTHFVDYANFPQSLKIVYVFDTNQALEIAKSEQLVEVALALTKSGLNAEGIVVPRLESALFFDTEENGADFNSARWCRKYS